ncbi:MAG TPA: DUF4266 domain-containing protein [Polyangia bacterium]
MRSRSVSWQVLVLLLAAAGVSGCARLKPWERGRLAHETMLLGDEARPGEAHVYAIHEGAVGGAAAVEGGCGCN